MVGPTVRIVSLRFISVDNYHCFPFSAFCPVPEGLPSPSSSHRLPLIQLSSAIPSVRPSLPVFLHAAIKCVAHFKWINTALSFPLCQMTASEKEFQTTALKVWFFFLSHEWEVWVFPLVKGRLAGGLAYRSSAYSPTILPL